MSTEKDQKHYHAVAVAMSGSEVYAQASKIAKVCQNQKIDIAVAALALATAAAVAFVDEIEIDETIDSMAAAIKAAAKEMRDQHDVIADFKGLVQPEKGEA